jgi:hypothetical protein
MEVVTGVRLRGMRESYSMEELWILRAEPSGRLPESCHLCLHHRHWPEAAVLGQFIGPRINSIKL